jgi:hypothetical protein
MDIPTSIELTRSERELLLNILHIAPDVEKKILAARITGNRFHIEFTPTELDGLLTGLAAEANANADRTMARAFDELREKLEATQARDGEVHRGRRRTEGAPTARSK